MCEISDKLKFCTCNKSSVSELKNYWILRRVNKIKDNFIIGEPNMPYGITEDYETNLDIILKRLNEPEAFDFFIKFQDDDHLEVCLNNFDNDQLKKMKYYFAYLNGKWHFTYSGTMNMNYLFDDIIFGNLKDQE